MEKTCINCASLLGCKLLSDDKGKFVPERIITETNLKSCNGWGEVGPLQKRVRDAMYGLQEENSLRVLHQLPDIVMKPLVEQEESDEMIVDMPDFAGMLWEGMTTADRDEQLRYETDESHNVTVDDDGNKRPRSTLVLRKFACDPEGHIQLDHSVGMFWTTEQVIKHILAVEVEQELITKAKKPKKGKQGQTEPAAAAAPKETKMAGKRVLITPKGKAAGASAGPKVGGPKAGGAKVAKPPARKGATQAPAEEEPAAAPAASVDFDVAALAEDTALKTAENVNALLIEQVNLLRAELDEVKKGMADIMDAVTIHYDMGVQTGGTYQYEDEEGNAQPLPEMFSHDKRILGFLDEGE